MAQVVPPALLDASTDILRRSFSHIMEKRVFTFACERGTVLSVQLLQKLQTAVRTRGIVVLTPGSLKSVLLKLIEALHFLQCKQETPTDKANQRDHLNNPGLSSSAHSRGSSKVGSVKNLLQAQAVVAGATQASPKKLRQEAYIAGKILELFRQG